jgi:hypothetical protein
MGVTPNSLPYPEDTDPVTEGAQAIRALAERLRIASGIATVPAGTSPRAVTVTLPPGLFTARPAIALGSGNTYVSVSVTGASAVNFTINGIYRTGSGAIANMPATLVHWVAVQIPS